MENVYDPQFAPDPLGNAQFPKLVEQGEDDRVAKEFNRAQTALWTLTGKFYPPQMLLIMMMLNHLNKCTCDAGTQSKTPEVPVSGGEDGQVREALPERADVQ